MVKNLACPFDVNLSSKSIVIKSLKKIIKRLQLLHGQKEFLNRKLHWLLCNSLIQPHFNYD